jgi:hypothetical protein
MSVQRYGDAQSIGSVENKWEWHSEIDLYYAQSDETNFKPYPIMNTFPRDIKDLFIIAHRANQTMLKFEAERKIEQAEIDRIKELDKLSCCARFQYHLQETVDHLMSKEVQECIEKTAKTCLFAFGVIMMVRGIARSFSQLLPQGASQISSIRDYGAQNFSANTSLSSSIQSSTRMQWVATTTIAPPIIAPTTIAPTIILPPTLPPVPLLPPVNIPEHVPADYHYDEDRQKMIITPHWEGDQVG